GHPAVLRGARGHGRRDAHPARLGRRALRRRAGAAHRRRPRVPRGGL
ncbi:MAG: hypothetical protein AVDCRST_MAG30-1306, partial [uncultured Solirubrobacteraceae bacterium]